MDNKNKTLNRLIDTVFTWYKSLRKRTNILSYCSFSISTTEVVFLFGNVTSISVDMDEIGCLVVMTKVGTYMVEKDRSKEFLNQFPRGIFMNAEELLSIYDAP